MGGSRREESVITWGAQVLCDTLMPLMFAKIVLLDVSAAQHLAILNVDRAILGMFLEEELFASYQTRIVEMGGSTMKVFA